MGRTVVFLAGLVAAGFLAGCVSHADDGRVTAHYLGYVQIVTTPASAWGVETTGARTVGGWWDVEPNSGRLQSTGLGYRQVERVALPPDCRLTILVTTNEQLAAVETLIATYAENDACAVKR